MGEDWTAEEEAALSRALQDYVNEKGKVNTSKLAEIIKTRTHEEIKYHLRNRLAAIPHEMNVENRTIPSVGNTMQSKQRVIGCEVNSASKQITYHLLVEERVGNSETTSFSKVPAIKILRSPELTEQARILHGLAPEWILPQLRNPEEVKKRNSYKKLIKDLTEKVTDLTKQTEQKEEMIKELTEQKEKLLEKMKEAQESRTTFLTTMLTTVSLECDNVKDMRLRIEKELAESSKRKRED